MKLGVVHPTVGLLLACTVLVGCSGDDGAADDDTTGTTSSSAGTDGPTTASTNPTSSSTDPTSSSGDVPTSGSTTDDGDSSSDSTDGDSSSGTGEGSDSSSDGSSGSGSSSSSGDPGDTESPSVVSVDPENGTTGVFADRSIVITFSEAMDEDSVAAALDSSELGAVTTSWNDDSTVLTIDPVNDLTYATGADPLTVAALEFEIAVSTAATDLAGNGLDATFESGFFTLRELTAMLGPDPDYSGTLSGSIPPQEATAFGDDPIVGDFSDNLARRGFMGFSLAALPEGIVEFISAEVSAIQWLVVGNPMPTLGDEVALRHLETPAEVPDQNLSAASAGVPGEWSVEDSGGPDNTKSVVVTANVEQDYDDGHSHCQFRLQLENQTNFNSNTDYLRYNDEVLAIAYLVP